MIVQDIECVKPNQMMLNLPLARVMWRPEPNLTVGAHCWILVGGAEMLRDWARIMDIEFVYITKDTEPVMFDRDLMVSEMMWNGRG